MKSFAVLVLIVSFLCCRGANEVAGPAGPQSVPPGSDVEVASSHRVAPVVVPRTHGAKVVAPRPHPTPNGPCRDLSSGLKRKNAPCEPCDGVTEPTTGDLKRKNKGCYTD